MACVMACKSAQPAGQSPRPDAPLMWPRAPTVVAWLPQSDAICAQAGRAFLAVHERVVCHVATPFENADASVLTG